MGGAVAIDFAARRPDLVRRLILSEPNLDPGGGFFSQPVAAMSEAHYVERGHDFAVRRALAEGERIWAGSLAAASALAVHRGAVSLVKGSAPTWFELLARLRMPRHLLFGARSLPHPDPDRLAGRGVAVHVVSEAGHSLATENPEGTARAIADALR
jgi:pimeloyl-ACP methyl ester carboxylesterase